MKVGCPIKGCVSRGGKPSASETSVLCASDALFEYPRNGRSIRIVCRFLKQMLDTKFAITIKGCTDRLGDCTLISHCTRYAPARKIVLPSKEFSQTWRASCVT